MNALKIITYSSLLLFFLACGGENDPSRLFSIQLEKNEIRVDETVTVSLRNKRDKQINSIAYFLDGEQLPVENDRITVETETLGSKTLIARVAFEDRSVEVPKEIRVLASEAPLVYTYEIINEFPHDSKAFTQGLEFYRDTLYESTGKRGESSIRKVDFTTGEVLEKVELERNYFGEGITLMGDKIYQLTWQNGIGFIYDRASLERTGRFKYGQSKEGWGLCNNGEVIYKSDGTERIWILNPDTLAEEGYIQTVTNTSIFNKANELEYVDGKIYANVWQKESMMIINANSGAIEGVVNFGGLKKRVTQHDQLDVLNGVAYHPTRNTFFITGKYWDKLFEVRITPRE